MFLKKNRRNHTIQAIELFHFLVVSVSLRIMSQNFSDSPFSMLKTRLKFPLNGLYDTKCPQDKTEEFKIQTQFKRVLSSSPFRSFYKKIKNKKPKTSNSLQTEHLTPLHPMCVFWCWCAQTDAPTIHKDAQQAIKFCVSLLHTKKELNQKIKK